MKTSLSHRLSLAALVLALSTFACIFNTKAPAAGPSNPSAGPGAQNLPEPASGLQDLKSYRAELTVSFTGTQDGNASQWTSVYTLVAEPARGTRLLSIASTGLPAESSLDGWMAGSYAGLLIERAGTWGPCEVQKNLDAPADFSFEPAGLLPPIKGAVDAGTENLQGINTSHFTFGQAAAGFPGKGTVNGEMWLAGISNYVLKYTLSAEGGPDLFGQDMQGTMRWDYQVDGIDQPIQVELPENCPPGPIEFPIMDGAEIIADQPGLQEYEIASDMTGVMAFYQGNATVMGYSLAEEYNLAEQPQLGETMDRMSFIIKPGLLLNVLVEQVSADTCHVLAVLERSSAENGGQPATPAPTSTVSPQVDLAQRLGQALSLLTTTSDKPSPLGSYHLEVNESVPEQDKASGKVNVSSVKIIADVEGTNYYLQHTQDGKVINDGYMIDGQEYDLKNGQVTQGMGLIDVDWASWPLDILMPYGLASLGPTPAGQETLDGRTTDVFELDSAKGDPASVSALQSMNPFSNIAITAASGKVWLDRQTGAMLKLTLAYTGELKDAQGASLGTADGQVDLSVTQVGAVSVRLP